MLEYYLRLKDHLNPVYEVDAEAGTYRLIASRIGVVDGVGGDLRDGGEAFRSDRFARVWKKAEADGAVTYTRDEPR